MSARIKKSLVAPEHGYVHREHRSKKSIKGLNSTTKRVGRLMRLQIQREYEKNYLKRFIQLRSALISSIQPEQLLIDRN